MQTEFNIRRDLGEASTGSLTSCTWLHSEIVFSLTNRSMYANVRNSIVVIDFSGVALFLLFLLLKHELLRLLELQFANSKHGTNKFEIVTKPAAVGRKISTTKSEESGTRIY